MIVKKKRPPEPLPDGEYRVKLASIEEKNSVNGPIFRWMFIVMRGEHKGERVSGVTDQEWQPEFRLDQFMTALGVDAEAHFGSKFDLANLVGRKAIAQVEVKDRSYRGKMQPRANVVSLSPAPIDEESTPSKVGKKKSKKSKTRRSKRASSSSVDDGF